MSQEQQTLTYAGTGVNYDVLDGFKKACQARAKWTENNANRLGVESMEMSRGESAYIMRIKHVSSRRAPGYQYFGIVEEGLGTKNLVADAMHKITGKIYYDKIAQDTIAMIVNDMATVGVVPVVIAMHLAVGSSDWLKDEGRGVSLIKGWANTCDLARCIWGPGETPTLKDIIYPEAALLSGSGIGIPVPDKFFNPQCIEAGDLIVLLESSGIHANGLTLARTIAANLEEGYSWRLSDGSSYGESLLVPTHIYCDFVEDCLNAGVNIKYGVNITGHGWRKIMRAPQPFAYVIDTLPRQLPIFDFIQKHGPVDDQEAYGNLNMGAGFALIINRFDAQKFEKFCEESRPKPRYRAFVAGHVEESSVKKVVIKPKGLEFAADTLTVR